jgi:hypothetical protein
MKKIFILSILTAFTFGLSQAAFVPKKEKEPKKSKEDQNSSKEEKKKAEADKKALIQELKNYEKNPDSYKAKKEEIQEQLDGDQTKMKQMQSDLSDAQNKQADAEKKANDDESQLKALQDQIEALKGKGGDGGSNGGEVVNTSKGTAYKVQLGLYRGLNVNRSFDNPRAIGYEQVDGMNRYVIGTFPDEQSAQNFVADIRKLGIHDAFVAKYIDGTRVYEWDNNPKYKGKKVPSSLNEALQH